MLTIRNGQLKAISENRVAASRARIIAALRMKLPDESASYSKQELQQFCDICIDIRRGVVNEGLGSDSRRD